MGERQNKPGLPAPAEVLDPKAAADVDAYLDDFFNFDQDEPREVQPSERDVATAALFDHARELCAEYAHFTDRKTQREWNKKQKITLPTTEIDGKEFQMSTSRDPITGATTITMTRPNIPDSGFTIVQKDKAATLNLDVADRPNALDDDQRYEDALNKAKRWIDRYAQAIGITPEPWLPKSEISEDEISRMVDSEIDRRARQHMRRKKIKGFTAVVLLAAGVTYTVGTGIEALLDWHRTSNAEFDATHFLPENAPTIHIGETKPVGDGSELSQEVIETADFTNGKSRDRVIENAGPHFIRASEDMEIAPKGHGNSFTFDCETIKLEGLGPRGTIKVVALKKDTATHLEAHLDREEMRICNTQTNEDASIKIQPRQLFIEVTNPQD